MQHLTLEEGYPAKALCGKNIKRKSMLPQILGCRKCMFATITLFWEQDQIIRKYDRKYSYLDFFSLERKSYGTNHHHRSRH